MNNSNIYKAVVDSVWSSLRIFVWGPVRVSIKDSVRSSVWDSVWDSVGESVGDSVKASVRNYFKQK